MKITTDACIFGAWVCLKNQARVLDVGTGTGLLSLMIAQRYPLLIDAVEIDRGAALQAGENIRASLWKDNITVRHLAFADLIPDPDCQYAYDHLICNPPFHDQQTKSHSWEKRIAWHNELLDLEQLMAGANGLLKETGTLHMMLPFSSKPAWTDICRQEGFWPIRLCDVKSFTGRSPHLFLSSLKRHPVQTETSTLIVYNEPQEYTESAYRLLQPYLLKL